MAIFTAEQLKQKFAGQLGQASAAPAPASAPGFTERVSQDFAKRNANVVDARSKVNSGQQSLASGLLQAGGQVAGLIGDVAFEGIKSITPQPIQDAVSGAASAVAQTAPVQQAVQNYEQWKSAHPEAAANLEAAINIGSLLPIGVGAGTAGKAAATVGGTAVKGTGSAVTVAGRALKGTGAALNNTAFTPNVQAAERILNYEAKAPFLTRVKNTLSGTTDPAKPRQLGDTAREKGLMGTERMVGVQAKREADKVWNEKIVPAVKGSDVQMTKEELFAPAQSLIDKTVDPTRKRSLQDGLDALMEDYADMDSFSLETAQALKRDLDKFTAAKQFRGQDVSSAVKTLQHEMADAIRQKTYAALDNKNDYLDWANLDALSDVGVKAISEARLKGGFGGFWSAMWDMTTTPIKTVGGQTLYRVGNALEFTGEKGLKRFGDFLKSKGFKRAQDLSAPTTIQTDQTPKKKASSSMSPTLPQPATKRINPNGDSKLGSANTALSKQGGAAWPTTASKQSKAGSISTGSAPTGKEGVSAQRAGTSGPFEGRVLYRGDNTTELRPNKAGEIDLTTDKNVAGEFSKQYGTKGVVNQVTIDPRAKVLSVDDYFKKTGKDSFSEEGIVEYALDNDYDIVDFSTLGRKGTLSQAEVKVLNPDVLRPSPSIPKELETKKRTK